ncbi:hypothetical protein [Salipiger pallidus]|uniref:hypothetical protein n=1 Tax=Salipiger pallidus TaxID=1775170 RepID=UPI00166C2CA8|nr:hypothetical protein [Salipiger pallidus]
MIEHVAPLFLVGSVRSQTHRSWHSKLAAIRSPKRYLVREVIGIIMGATSRSTRPRSPLVSQMGVNGCQLTSLRFKQPSLMPVRDGERLETDQPDAMRFACLMRAEALRQSGTRRDA